MPKQVKNISQPVDYTVVPTLQYVCMKNNHFNKPCVDPVSTRKRERSTAQLGQYVDSINLHITDLM